MAQLYKQKQKIRNVILLTREILLRILKHSQFKQKIGNLQLKVFLESNSFRTRVKTNLSRGIDITTRIKVRAVQLNLTFESNREPFRPGKASDSIGLARETQMGRQSMVASSTHSLKAPQTLESATGPL